MHIFSVVWLQCLRGWKTKYKNPDSGPEICDQELGFLLHTPGIFLARMIFVKWKYYRQINIDNSILTFLYKKSVFMKCKL